MINSHPSTRPLLPTAAALTFKTLMSSSLPIADTATAATPRSQLAPNTLSSTTSVSTANPASGPHTINFSSDSTLLAEPPTTTPTLATSPLSSQSITILTETMSQTAHRFCGAMLTTTLAARSIPLTVTSSRFSIQPMSATSTVDSACFQSTSSISFQSVCRAPGGTYSRTTRRRSSNEWAIDAQPNTVPSTRADRLLACPPATTGCSQKRSDLPAFDARQV